jgi:hypothetical protein
VALLDGSPIVDIPCVDVPVILEKCKGLCIVVPKISAKNVSGLTPDGGKL